MSGESLTLNQLEKQVSQIKLDLDSLKTETSTDIKKTKVETIEKDVTATKESIQKELDALKGHNDTESLESKKKLDAMLVTLETTASENILKAAITSTPSNSGTKNNEKKNNSIWLGRNRGWLVGGTAALRLGHKIFGKKKDTDTKDKTIATTNDKTADADKDTPDADKDTDTSSGFGSKVWKAIKYGGLAVGGYFGFKWLIGKDRYHAALDRLNIRNRPEAPVVTANDTANTITGLIVGMEYSIDDGKTYIAYDVSKTPTFIGDQKVLVRTAKTDDSAESKTKELIFTKGGTTTSPDVSNTTVDTSTKILTAEELTKRNTAITDSINKATTFPVTIDYGTDKTVLEAKGCPTIINFDATTQSILLGTEQLKVNIGSFETQTSFGKATVDSVTVNSISYSADAFKLNVTGTGKKFGISQTDTQDVDVTKTEILSMLQPYYVDGKNSYDVSITDKDNNVVPISIEKITGSLDAATDGNATPIPGFETAFESVDARKKTQYTTLGDKVSAMYTTTMKSVTPNLNLPKLLVRQDASLTTSTNYGAIMYVLDEKYNDMDTILHDDFFTRIEAKTDLIIDDIVEFLKKYKDNKIFGGIFKTVATWLDKILKGGGFDEESLKRQLEDDPVALAQLKTLIKKISITRFFVSEKRNIYKKQLTDNPDTKDSVDSTLKDTFDTVKFVGANQSDISLYTTLKDNAILDSEISTETSAGIALNKAAEALQTKIKNTNSNLDYSGKRGNITYDYTTSKLKSRGNETEIEIIPRDTPITKTKTASDEIAETTGITSPKIGSGVSGLKDLNNTFRIKDLPISFEYTDEVVRVSNYINNMMDTYGSSIAERLKNNVTRDILVRRNGYGTFTDLLGPGIYETQSTLQSVNPFYVPNQILEKGTLYGACPNWGDDEAEALVAYLNKRFAAAI